MSSYLIPELLDRTSPRPLYTQIYEQLKRELVLGDHQAGARFYSYRKLKDIYKTEVRTIGAAIKLLIADGLVEMRSTSGIYVVRKERISEVGNVWYAVMTAQSYHPFFFNVLLGLINEAEKYGLRVVIRIGKKREEFLEWFVPRPGEGLILSGELDDALLKAAGKKCNNHIIVVGNYHLHGDFGNVTTNSRGCLIDSLKIAAERGCRRFALITNSVQYPISQSLREVLSECAKECGAEYTFIEELTENGYCAMRCLESFRPDCVLMTEPAFAGVWEYMVEHRLSCPEDIFLIRYGKEQNDRTLVGRAAIDLECNSELHGATALKMLLKNSKNVDKVDIMLKSNL